MASQYVSNEAQSELGEIERSEAILSQNETNEVVFRDCVSCLILTSSTYHGCKKSGIIRVKDVHNLHSNK